MGWGANNQQRFIKQRSNKRSTPDRSITTQHHKARNSLAEELQEGVEELVAEELNELAKASEGEDEGPDGEVAQKKGWEVVAEEVGDVTVEAGDVEADVREAKDSEDYETNEDSHRFRVRILNQVNYVSLQVLSQESFSDSVRTPKCCDDAAAAVLLSSFFLPPLAPPPPEI